MAVRAAHALGEVCPPPRPSRRPSQTQQVGDDFALGFVDRPKVRLQN